MSPSSERVKRSIPTIAARNRVFARIIQAIAEKDAFLLLGHVNPDEDCLGALVSFGLLLRKFGKRASIYLRKPIPEQFSFLSAICEFNGIELLVDRSSAGRRYSCVAVLDTPKPAMIEADDAARNLFADPSVLKIEIDHHLETDAEYFGDEDYRLVSNASSTCELIGLLAYKIDRDPDLKRRFASGEVFTRNLVLAVITGVIGDSRMGKYLKTARERRLYLWVSELFDRMLADKTHHGSENFKSKEQIFEAMATLSDVEEDCFNRIYSLRRRGERIDSIVLTQEEADRLRESFGEEIFLAMVKSAADKLAEDNGTFGFIVYPDSGDLVQFRVRRSRSYTDFDLRELLARFDLKNGGGHPGAIGFRLPKTEVADIVAFSEDMIARTTGALRTGNQQTGAE